MSPLHLGKFPRVRKNLARFSLYFINNGGFAQKRTQGGFYERPHLWRLLDVIELLPRRVPQKTIQIIKKY